MSKPEDVEVILARLMPVALSERSGMEMEETIDQLVLEGGFEISAVRPAPVRWPWVAGIAAALVLAVSGIWKPDAAPSAQVADVLPSTESVESAEVVRISQTDTLQSVVQEGWHDDVGGKPHQALRLHMLAQQQIRDEETGIVMTVSEPREEVLLVPVHTF